MARAYLLCLWSFTTVNHLKFDLVSLVKITIPVALDCGIMNEYFLPAIVRVDETISFETTEPLHDTSCFIHLGTSTTAANDINNYNANNNTQLSQSTFR